ncbi:MAG: hypothetical protein K9W45_12595 [Candidatus Heimdallarchaeum aukensis]|uniref:Uncharacterized protein n=1 Tax=Candidatus Heimdallarchaeum aukensis TaxID=2876573 RepID=A0A9Y1FKV1_9ARCH|nr:MAG: hypothetical protein K9W45_12595 [Candidatus Heimdallarchaeum aukensis]
MVSVETYLVLCLVIIFIGLIAFKYHLTNIKFIYGITVIYIGAICLSFLFNSAQDEIIFVYTGIFSILTIILLAIKSPVFEAKIKENEQ